MEKQFNIQESFIVKMKQNLDAQQENLNPKDRKFFNLDILMDISRITQKHSYECKVCAANKDILLDLSTSISEKVNTLEGRREITKTMDLMTTHLRKKHKMYIRRYMSSLYTIIILLIGLLAGAIYGFFSHEMKIPLLVGGAIGLFIGSIIGGIKEKRLKNHEQIYGKF